MYCHIGDEEFHLITMQFQKAMQSYFTKNSSKWGPNDKKNICFWVVLEKAQSGIRQWNHSLIHQAIIT